MSSSTEDHVTLVHVQNEDALAVSPEEHVGDLLPAGASSIFLKAASSSNVPQHCDDEHPASQSPSVNAESSGSDSLPAGDELADRLRYWKDCVKQNVRGSYYHVGESLHNVLHSEKLLNAQKFISWSHENFGLTRSTAYEYIRAYKIVDMIRVQDGSLPVPSTLSHFRVFNKISLKDHGLQAFRLWQAILESTPADNRSRLTAKEVLAKGKQILHGRGAAWMAGCGGYVSYHDETSERRPVGKHRRRRPVREHARRAVGYLQNMQKDQDSDSPMDSDYHDNSDYDEDHRGNPMPPATKRRYGSKNASYPASRDSAAGKFHSLSVPSPPPLMPLEMTPVRLAGFGRRIIRSGFDISVCPSETTAEARVINAPTTFKGDGYCREWKGTVYGNFAGAQFRDEDLLGLYIDAAIDKFNSGEYDTGMFIVNLAFGSRSFQKLLEYPHCFLKTPLVSMTVDSDSQSADICHNQVVVAYLGGDFTGFVQLMSNYGLIPGSNSWCNYRPDSC